MKVLVVDDEKLVRRGLISMMPWEKYGMKVISEAMNGSKALECMAVEPADIVFTDLMMPEMSGFELMEELKNHYPATLVVVLSCHEEFAFAQQAIRMGAIDYVVKNDLETDVMDEVLERIAMSVQNKASSRVETKQTSLQSKSFYDALFDLIGEPSGSLTVELPQRDIMEESSAEACQLLWQDLKWIYDNKQYEQLMQQTTLFRLSLPLLKNIVYPVLLKTGYLLLSLERSLHWISRLEQSRCWKDWRLVMQEERDYLGNLLFREKHTTEVVNGILQAVQYMHAKEELDFSQNEVADVANMSRTYFSQSFKGVTGKAFQDYVKELRLYKARQLLLQSSKPIYSIAQQVGFKDEKYFSKMFQKQYGLLPSAYRAQNPLQQNLWENSEGRG
ncbi:response regulator [Paenibacillus sp. 19GGS1-52]|uniref:response regulator transcription factor n=1 Tax=Paenibacillus sp. 19GGS1-52 TaxID=2758563 RepID=UPI001EFA908A|nr:helix-turn-helix domain-containing protein [Paenibacillus sp. 19GGS1-52]ULO07108.1 response regulator [Paenibacillus sp. 19GGS1-52]